MGEDFALWVSTPPPPPMRVQFALGSAALSAEARDVITATAANAGAWHFEVRGGFSPEGSNDRNRALAERRAIAVSEALVAAGVAEDHVQVAAEEVVSSETSSLEALRVAVIYPVVEAP